MSTSDQAMHIQIVLITNFNGLMEVTTPGRCHTWQLPHQKINLALATPDTCHTSHSEICNI